VVPEFRTSREERLFLVRLGVVGLGVVVSGLAAWAAESANLDGACATGDVFGYLGYIMVLMPVALLVTLAVMAAVISF